MPKDAVGFQVNAPKQQQTQEPQPQPPSSPSTISGFIVDDIKLFVSPVKAVVNEFVRQVKRTAG